MAAQDQVLMEEVRRENDALGEGTDAVLLSVDWRVEELTVDGVTTQRHYYLRGFLSQYIAFIKLMSLAAYVALPAQPPGAYKANIVGVVFAGGRDLHPRFYNETVAGANLNPASETRYPWTLEQYRWARGRVPVLGICWGSQFLVVAGGGSLVQHLPNAQEHAHAVTAISVQSGSWLRAAAGAAEMSVQCLHHQGFKRVPPRFRVVARDAAGMPHAFQSVGGMLELGLLFHPEQRPDDAETQRLASAFGALCLRVKAAAGKELQALVDSAYESTGDEGSDAEQLLDRL